jgi:hypothetical protein
LVAVLALMMLWSKRQVWAKLGVVAADWSGLSYVGIGL